MKIPNNLLVRVLLTFVLAPIFGAGAGYTLYSNGCDDATPPPSFHSDAGLVDDEDAGVPSDEDAGAE